MRKRARIVTPWTGGNASEMDHFRPQVQDDYPLFAVTDVTGQPVTSLPPDPNLFIVEAECAPETLDAIAADPRYLVLWEETLA